MAPRKRISKVVSRETSVIVEEHDNNTRSISSQTDPLKPGMLRVPTQKRRLVRPTVRLAPPNGLANASVSINDVHEYGDDQQTRNKSTQTLKTGLGPTVVNQNREIDEQMDNLKALMKKRRADAIGWDHERASELKRKINADPPPSWQAASEMWLEIDKLEERIRAHESEESKDAGTTNDEDKENNEEESG